MKTRRKILNWIVASPLAAWTGVKVAKAAPASPETQGLLTQSQGDCYISERKYRLRPNNGEFSKMWHEAWYDLQDNPIFNEFRAHPSYIRFEYFNRKLMDLNFWQHIEWSLENKYQPNVYTEEDAKKLAEAKEALIKIREEIYKTKA